MERHASGYAHIEYTSHLTTLVDFTVHVVSDAFIGKVRSLDLGPGFRAQLTMRRRRCKDTG